MTKHKTTATPKSIFAASDIDPSFGNKGYARVPSPDDPEQSLILYTIAVDPTDGGQKFYIDAHQTSSLSYIVRFLPDGQIDTSFGDNGYAPVPQWAFEVHFALIVDHVVFSDSGTITCIGTAELRDGSIVVGATRMTVSGEIDTRFGDNGIRLYKLPAPLPEQQIKDTGRSGHAGLKREISFDQRVDRNGRTLMTARVTRQADEQILFLAPPYLIRINSDGSLDAGFGENGLVQVTDPTLPPANPLRFRSYSIDRRGGITVIADARRDTAGDYQGIVARYDSKGHRDPHFGNSGITHIPNPDGNVQLRAVHTLEDGSVIVAGGFFKRDSPNVQQDCAVIKLLSDGTHDDYFNSGTPLLIDLTPSSFIGSTIAVDDGRRIVISGARSLVEWPYVYIQGSLSRCMPNGTMDSEFGLNGTAVYEDFGSLWNGVIQGKKNILASAVYQPEPGPVSYIVRFLG